LGEEELIIVKNVKNKCEVFTLDDFSLEEYSSVNPEHFSFYRLLRQDVQVRKECILDDTWERKEEPIKKVFRRKNYMVYFRGVIVGVFVLSGIGKCQAVSISYALDRNYRNLGLGTKMLSFFCQYIDFFLEEVEFIYAFAQLDNMSSRKVLENNGFVQGNAKETLVKRKRKYLSQINVK